MIDDYNSFNDYLFSDELLNLSPEERQEAVMAVLNTNEPAEILEATSLRFEPPSEWGGQSTYDALNVAMKCAKTMLLCGGGTHNECKKGCRDSNDCPVVEFKKSPRPLSLNEYIALNSNDLDRDACMAVCRHCSSLYLLTMRAINSLKVSAK